MNRPEFKDFFPESTTVADIQTAFIGHPELYRYLTALDAYVDWLEEKIGDSNIEETCPVCESSDQLVYTAHRCNRCKMRIY